MVPVELRVIKKSLIPAHDIRQLASSGHPCRMEFDLQYHNPIPCCRTWQNRRGAARNGDVLHASVFYHFHPGLSGRTGWD